MSKRKILLICRDEDLRNRIEGPLLVAGYLVLYKKNTADLQTSGPGAPPLSQVDLLLVPEIQLTADLLKRWQRNEVRALLLFQPSNNCNELYCVEDGHGCLHDLSALLAAVKELLGRPKPRDQVLPSLGCSSAKESSRTG